MEDVGIFDLIEGEMLIYCSMYLKVMGVANFVISLYLVWKGLILNLISIFVDGSMLR